MFNMPKTETDASKEASMLTRVLRVPEATRERILACQREEDWDEEGGMGITESSCKASVRFLEDVLERKEALPMPRISASAFGAVTFQWRNGNEHLIIRVFSDTGLVFHHSEVIGEFRDVGEEPRSEAVERVLRLFASYAS